MLAQNLAHGVRDDLWQIRSQAAQLSFKPVETPVVAIEPTIDPIETRFDPVDAGADRGKIVPVAAGLLENIPRDDLLALDLLLKGSHAPLKGFDLAHRSVPMLSAGVSYSAACAIGPALPAR